MPELPEVETVCQGLRNLVIGRAFRQVELFRPDLRVPFPPDFAARLEGRRIAAIRRRAKYILLCLDDGVVLLIHLGMSGRLMVHPFARNDRHTHDHVIFKLEDGQEIVFNDPRRFGLMALTEEALLPSHPLLVHLGPEPLEQEFDAKMLYGRLQGKKAPVKTVLMDNRVVVGIGNIYACESLFDAGISPLKPAGALTMKEGERLVGAIRKVLNAALASGGSSLRDYRQASGESGYFQHQFLVYGREGEACARCKVPIIRIVQAGRSSFYCRECQG